jgi:hypothetical protein
LLFGRLLFGKLLFGGCFRQLFLGSFFSAMQALKNPATIEIQGGPI